MSWASRGQDRKRLELEDRGERLQESLERLAGGNDAFRGLSTWPDVIALMREGSSRDPRKNDILLAILREYRGRREVSLLTVLVLMFWPALEAIHGRKRTWDSDADNRWQNVLAAFLRAVSRLDPGKRSTGLVQKLINDTYHLLYEAYLPEWGYLSRKQPSDPDAAGALWQRLCLGAAVEEPWEEAAARLVGDYSTRGWISERDVWLIVGTRIYGKTLAEYADAVGISEDTAGKRRQRAEAAIWKRLKKSHLP